MEERLSMIKRADVSFLCLPDAASPQGISSSRASRGLQDLWMRLTAHRTDDSWVYEGCRSFRGSGRRLIREEQQSGCSRVPCHRGHPVDRTSS